MGAENNGNEILLRYCPRSFHRRLLVCGLLLGVAAFCCHAENEEAIKEFGVEKSKRITSGFLFHGYAYVEVPYVVERKGLDVSINGILIAPGPRWPRKDRTVKDDPGEPPAGSSPWHDPTRYFSRKWIFLSGKYDLKDAIPLMVEVYKKCPEVKDASSKAGLPDGAVTITSNKGREELPMILDEDWKQENLSRERALEIATHSFNHAQDALRCGAFWWVIQLGDEMTMGRTEAAKILEVMFSGVNPAEKAKQLRKQNLLEPEMAKLVTECPHNEQLAKRFERLKKGEVEEDPVEPPGPPGDPQAAQAPQSKTLPYPWLGGGLAVVAVVIALLAWRLRRK